MYSHQQHSDCEISSIGSKGPKLPYACNEGKLSSCCFSVIPNQSTHSSPNSDINRVFFFCPHNYCSMDVLSDFGQFTTNLRGFCGSIPNGSTVSEMQTLACLAITAMTCLKSIFLPFCSLQTVGIYL